MPAKRGQVLSPVPSKDSSLFVSYFCFIPERTDLNLQLSREATRGRGVSSRADACIEHEAHGEGEAASPLSIPQENVSAW